MPEPGKGKYSALAEVRQRPQTESPAEVVTVDPPTLPPPISAGRVGRPTGKRSDPSFQPTTVLLRRQTKKLATRRLEDVGSGQDLSELIEQLLSVWISQ